MMPLYRSKIHSPLEANPNKYRTDTLSPLEASPNKYRSREASALVAQWTPPGELVGWYKLDEGGGVIAYNSANPIINPTQKLPDLPIVLNPVNFWSINPGFGSSGVPQTKALWTDAASTLTTGGGSVCEFVYIAGASTNAYPQHWNCQSGVVDASDGRILDQRSTIGGNIQFGGYRNITTFGLSIAQFPYASSINRWIFFFAYDFGAGGISKVGLVRDDGVLFIGENSGGIWNNNQLSINQIRLFRYYDSANTILGYFRGSLGDIMIWRGSYLSLSNFASIYDQLRSRYGMAARSGW